MKFWIGCLSIFLIIIIIIIIPYFIFNQTCKYLRDKQISVFIITVNLFGLATHAKVDVNSSFKFQNFRTITNSQRRRN